jgi:hypothetical protein
MNIGFSKNLYFLFDFKFGEFNYLNQMIELKYELDMYPMVKNRSIVNIFPTKVYLNWLNYIHGSDVCFAINDLEPISFLIKDFDVKSDFDYWLENNFQLMFEIRLNYSCVDKSLWPEERTFCNFNKWFDIRFSNLILNIEDEPIILI